MALILLQCIHSTGYMYIVHHAHVPSVPTNTIHTKTYKINLLVNAFKFLVKTYL